MDNHIERGVILMLRMYGKIRAYKQGNQMLNYSKQWRNAAREAMEANINWTPLDSNISNLQAQMYLWPDLF